MLIDDALNQMRHGRFRAAGDLVAQARQVDPVNSEAKSLPCLIAYLRQYDELADAAFSGLGKAGEVDLGPRYGIVAIVEQDAGRVVFHSRGRNVRLSRDEFDALEDVKFWVTRDFLSRGGRPANDLILGAVHFVLQLDEHGRQDSSGEVARNEARKYWEQARESEDRRVAEDAVTLLALLGGE